MPTPPDPPRRPPDPRLPAPPRPPVRPLPHPRDFAAEEDAERRLNSVQIQLRRGLFAEAEAAAQAILKDRPEDAVAYELLGDALAARGDEAGAIGSYQAALKIEPGRASAEAKFATATLQRAERERQQKLGVAYAAADTAMVRRTGGERGGWLIVVGSMICPGLGQIVQGQTGKGAAMIAVFVLCLGLLALLPHGSRGGSYFSAGFWLVAAVLTGDWLYAVTDAAMTSSQKS